jgi:hypothetical protein
MQSLEKFCKSNPATPQLQIDRPLATADDLGVIWQRRESMLEKCPAVKTATTSTLAKPCPKGYSPPARTKENPGFEEPA